MSLPRMSWHIGDYKKDTGHLRAAGHGGYFLLIMHYWATGGLPNDDQQLAAIACMTDKEWKHWKPVLGALFQDGWKHKRIEAELQEAQEKYERRSGAGKKGGKAKANGKQCSSNATPDDQAKPKQPITDNPIEDSEANASGGSPPADFRTELFGRGLKALAEMTGKTPDSCRSTVGKWLKMVDDEAIHVLAAIDDCQRNRQADPVGWIFKVLQTHGKFHGKARSGGTGRDTIQDAIGRQLARFEREASGDDEAGSDSPRLLSHG